MSKIALPALVIEARFGTTVDGGGELTLTVARNWHSSTGNPHMLANPRDFPPDLIAGLREWLEADA